MAKTTIKQMKETIKEVYGKEIRIDLDNISTKDLTEMYELATSVTRYKKALEIRIFECEESLV